MNEKMWSTAVTCAILMTSWGKMTQAQGSTYHVPEPPAFFMKAPPKPPWISDEMSCPGSDLVILSSPDPIAASEWPSTTSQNAATTAEKMIPSQSAKLNASTSQISKAAPPSSFFSSSVTALHAKSTALSANNNARTTFNVIVAQSTSTPSIKVNRISSTVSKTQSAPEEKLSTISPPIDSISKFMTPKTFYNISSAPVNKVSSENLVTPDPKNTTGETTMEGNQPTLAAVIFGTDITTVGLAMGVTILMVLLMLLAAFFVYKWHKNKTESQKVSPKRVQDNTNYLYNYHVRGRKYVAPPEDRNSSTSAALSIGEHSSLVKNEAGLRHTHYLRISPHKDRLSLESNSSGIGTGASEVGEDGEEEYVTIQPPGGGQPMIAMHQQLPSNLLPVVRRHMPEQDPNSTIGRRYQTISASHPATRRKLPVPPREGHPTGSLRRPPLSPQPIMGLKARAVTQGLPTTSLHLVQPTKEQDLVLDPVLLQRDERKKEARPLRRKHHRHRNSDSYFSDTESHDHNSRRMAVKYVKNYDSDADNRDVVYMNRNAASETEA